MRDGAVGDEGAGVRDAELSGALVTAHRAMLDPGLLARFVAVYQGPHDAMDALQWIMAPRSDALSGEADPEVALDRLRTRLYRSDVTADDRRRHALAAATVRRDTAAVVTALAAAADAEAVAPAARRATERPPGPDGRSNGAVSDTAGAAGGGSRSWRVLTLVVVVGVLVVVAGALTVIALPRADRQVASPTPTPLASGVVESYRHQFVGTAAQQRRQRSELAALFTSARSATLGSYLFAHRLTLGAILPTDRFAVDYRGRGPAEIPLTGLDGGGASNALTVLLTCDRPASYAWSMSADRYAAPTVPVGRTSGPDCGGALIASSFASADGQVPTTLRITVPESVEYLIEVDLIRL